MQRILTKINLLVHKIKPQSKKSWFIFVLLFLGLGIFVVQPVFAEDIGSAVLNSVMQAITWIALGLSTWCIKMTIFLLGFIIEIAGYNGYLDTPAVTVGWVMVRDVTNMFFVVILLIIAFGTILGLEQYEWKKLMVKFVLAAILVNFSRIICGLFIDVAQVFMVTFVNAVAATAGGNLIRMFSMESILSMSEGNLPESFTDANLFVSAAAGLFFAAIMMAVMFAYMIILLFRMLVLWVLIILSPLAFVLNVIPQSQSYSARWWKEFGNHVMVGPVLIFFLWLSFVTAGAGNIHDHIRQASIPNAQMDVTATNANNEQTEASTGLTGIMTWTTMANFFIAVGMLLVGVRVSNELGVEGGGALNKAVDFGKKVAMMGTGITAGMWAAKGIGDRAQKVGSAIASLPGKAIDEAMYYAPLVGGRRWEKRGRRIKAGIERFYKENEDLRSYRKADKEIMRESARRKKAGEAELTVDDKQAIRDRFLSVDKINSNRDARVRRENEKLAADAITKENIRLQQEGKAPLTKEEEKELASRSILTDEQIKEKGWQKVTQQEIEEKGVSTEAPGVFKSFINRVYIADKMEDKMLESHEKYSEAIDEYLEEAGALTSHEMGGRIRKVRAMIDLEKPRKEAKYLSDKADVIESGFLEDPRWQYRPPEEDISISAGKGVAEERTLASYILPAWLTMQQMARPDRAFDTEKHKFKGDTAVELEKVQRGEARKLAMESKSAKDLQSKVERSSEAATLEEEMKAVESGVELKHKKTDEGLEEEKRRLEAEKGRELTESEWEKIKKERELEFEKSDRGEIISATTVAQKEETKTLEDELKTHTEKERKEFYEEEDKNVRNQIINSGDVNDELEKVMLAEVELKNIASNVDLEPLQESIDEAMTEAGVAKEKLNNLWKDVDGLSDEDLEKLEPQLSKAEEDYDNALKNKEKKEAELKDRKKTTGLITAETELKEANKELESKISKLRSTTETTMSRQNAAELGAQQAQAFIDKIKQVNLSDIFKEAGKSLKKVFNDLKIDKSKGITEENVKKALAGVENGIQGSAMQAMYAQQLKDYYTDLSGIDKAEALDKGDDLVSIEKLGFVKQSTAFKQALSKNTENLQNVEREQAVKMTADSLKEMLYLKSQGKELDTMQQASLMSGLKFLIQNGWNDDLLGRIIDMAREDVHYNSHGDTKEEKSAVVFRDLFIKDLGWGRMGVDNKGENVIEATNRSGHDRANDLNRLITLGADGNLLQAETAVLKYQKVQKENGKKISYDEAVAELASKIGNTKELESLKETKNGFRSGELEKFGDDFKGSAEKFMNEIDKCSAQLETFAGWKSLAMDTTHLDDLGHTMYDMDSGRAHGQLADDALDFVLADWIKVGASQRVSKLKIHAIANLNEDTGTASNFIARSVRATFDGVNSERIFERIDSRNRLNISKMSSSEDVSKFKDKEGRLTVGARNSDLVAKTFKGDSKAAMNDIAKDFATMLREAPQILLASLGGYSGVNWDKAAEGRMNIKIGNKNIDTVDELVDWINKQDPNQNLQVESVKQSLKSALKGKQQPDKQNK